MDFQEDIVITRFEKSETCQVEFERTVLLEDDEVITGHQTTTSETQDQTSRLTSSENITKATETLLSYDQPSKQQQTLDRQSRPSQRGPRMVKSRARSFESDKTEDETAGGQHDAADLPGGLRRTQSLKRRDHSWDKRWMNHVRPKEDVKEERPSRGFRPGRLDCSFWEGKGRSETALFPRTPPPKMKLRYIDDGRSTPQMRNRSSSQERKFLLHNEQSRSPVSQMNGLVKEAEVRLEPVPVEKHDNIEISEGRKDFEAKTEQKLLTSMITNPAGGLGGMEDSAARSDNAEIPESGTPTNGQACTVLTMDESTQSSFLSVSSVSHCVSLIQNEDKGEVLTVASNSVAKADPTAQDEPNVKLEPNVNHSEMKTEVISACDLNISSNPVMNSRSNPSIGKEMGRDTKIPSSGSDSNLAWMNTNSLKELSNVVQEKKDAVLEDQKTSIPTQNIDACLVNITSEDKVQDDLKKERTRSEEDMKIKENLDMGPDRQLSQTANVLEESKVEVTEHCESVVNTSSHQSSSKESAVIESINETCVTSVTTSQTKEMYEKMETNVINMKIEGYNHGDEQEISKMGASHKHATVEAEGESQQTERRQDTMSTPTVLPPAPRLSPMRNGSLLEAASMVTNEFSNVMGSITSLNQMPPSPPPRSSSTLSLTGKFGVKGSSSLAIHQEGSDAVNEPPLNRSPTPPPLPPPCPQLVDSETRVGGAVFSPPPPLPLPPTPPPPEEAEEIQSLPSPPPEAATALSPTPPPRPSPPRAPAPPARSTSHSVIRDVGAEDHGASLPTTPTQRRRIVVRAVETPSPVPQRRQPQQKASCPGDNNQLDDNKNRGESEEMLDEVGNVGVTILTGTFQALPVTVDETLPEDMDIIFQDDKEASPVHKLSVDRKNFLTEMLVPEKAASLAADTLAVLQSKEASNRQEEERLLAEIERKQHEVEVILAKKKQEEELKRKEFEEERKRELSIRIKRECEEKRRREKDDKVIQAKKEEILWLESEAAVKEERERRSREEQRLNASKEKMHIEEYKMKKWAISERERRSEERRLGRSASRSQSRETKYNSQEDVRSSPRAVSKSPRPPPPIQKACSKEKLTATNSRPQDPKPVVNNSSSQPKANERTVNTEQVKSKAETDSVQEVAKRVITPEPKSTCDETIKISKETLSPSVAYPLQGIESCDTKMFKEANITILSPKEEEPKQALASEKSSTVTYVTDKLVIEELNDSESLYSDHNGIVVTPKDSSPEAPKLTEEVRMKNRMMQKNRSNHFKENSFLQEDMAKDQGYSASTRWKDVKIGLVKDRANTYMRPDEIPHSIYEKSPRIRRKLMNPTYWMKSGGGEHSDKENSSPPRRDPAARSPCYPLGAEGKSVKQQTKEYKQNAKDEQEAILIDSNYCHNRLITAQEPQSKAAESWDPVSGQAQETKDGEESGKSSQTEAPSSAPWRTRPARTETKSPTLNLVSVLITPSQSSTQLSLQSANLDEDVSKVDSREIQPQNTTGGGVNSQSTPSINGTTEMRVETKSVQSTEYSTSKITKEVHAHSVKTSAVANLDITMNQLQEHVKLLEDNKPSSVTMVGPLSTASTVNQTAASVKDTAGAVKNLANNLLKAISPDKSQPVKMPEPNELEAIKAVIAGRNPDPHPQHDVPEKNIRAFASLKQKARTVVLDDDDDDEDDSFGYEDDFSIGIDLPMGTETTSGNVTPTPTTGELEELSSVDEPTVIEILPREVSGGPGPDHPPSGHGSQRATPLKSLLKKPSFEVDSDSDLDDGKCSPAKKVHFSEIDQIKLMSHESLASMARFDTSSNGSDSTLPPVTLCKTVMTSTPVPSVPRIVQRDQQAAGYPSPTREPGNA